MSESIEYALGALLLYGVADFVYNSWWRLHFRTRSANSSAVGAASL